jgi:hypothetical protein
MYFYIKKFSAFGANGKRGFLYVYQCFNDSTVQKIKMLFKSA